MGDNKLLGIIAVADVIKEDSPKAIKELQNMGLSFEKLAKNCVYSISSYGD